LPIGCWIVRVEADISSLPFTSSAGRSSAAAVLAFDVCILGSPDRRAIGQSTDPFGLACLKVRARVDAATSRRPMPQLTGELQPTTREGCFMW
jgi:hypothetical protein